MPSSNVDFQLLLGYIRNTTGTLVEDYYVATKKADGTPTPISFGGDQAVWSQTTKTYSTNKEWLIQQLHLDGRLAPDWESKLYGSSTSESNLFIYGIIAATIATAYFVFKKK